LRKVLVRGLSKSWLKLEIAFGGGVVRSVRESVAVLLLVFAWEMDIFERIEIFFV
jgi:hypothetical protein